MIKFKVRDKAVRDLLRKMAQKGVNLRPAMTEIKGVMVDAVEDNFEAEGRPRRWKGLKAETKEARAKRGHWPGKILQGGSAGGLKSSITGKADGKRAIVGTNKVYGATHQYGDASRGIPKREFLFLGRDDIEEIEEILLDHFMR